MKRLFASLFGILALIALSGFAHEYPFLSKFPPDDTAALQALLNTVMVTLPAGHVPYNISSNLNITSNFSLNGNVINMNGPSGAALKIRNPNITVSNGTVTGPWTAAVACNPNGASGIVIYA